MLNSGEWHKSKKTALAHAERMRKLGYKAYVRRVRLGGIGGSSKLGWMAQWERPVRYV